jgi:hypothetical protein
VWFQLYSRNDWGETRQMLKRAESAGAPVVAYTIDLLGGRNTDHGAPDAARHAACTQCYAGAMLDNRRKPMVAGLTHPYADAGSGRPPGTT